MEQKRTFIENDYRRLAALAMAVKRSAKPELASALDRCLGDAVVLPEGVFGNGTVVMGSVCRIRQEDSGETFEYRLVFPGDADIRSGKLSVLTPLGASLLGRRQGEIFEYDSPGGRQCVRIESVSEGEPTA